MSTTPSSKDTSFKRVPSGIAGLDTILRGGFFQGGSYIVQGAPGTGKTILTNQICFHHAAGGGRALFVTLLAENHARMIGNLRELAFFDEARIPDQLTYLSAFNELREGGLKGVIDLLRREIQRSRGTMLVIDGLISLQTNSESDLAFKEFVHDLQEVALATDCTMFLTTSVGKAISPEQTMVDGLLELSNRSKGSRTESDFEILKFRGTGFLRGPHSYTITQAGIVVYPRIETLLAHPTRADKRVFGRTSTGNGRLDAMLGGGVPVGSTTMIMGPSGIGKTTLGLQFLSQSSKAEPGLMFGFYETPARLHAKAGEVCQPLGPLFNAGVVELLWQTPTSDGLDAYGGRLLEAIHRRKVKRLYIDGLTGFKNAAIDPSRVGHFFTALANELRMLGVTTFYSLEVPDILGPAIRIPIDDLASLAENMVILRYIELRSQLYRLISIIKVRDSDFDGSLYEFAITKKGVKIHDTTQSAEAVLSGLNAGGEPIGRKSRKKKLPARSVRRGT
jgi:circadian clock protein KaiC